jgi:ABC transporter substrate binding protein (PQQ-dependent alcohol dehydrogenase system)
MGPSGGFAATTRALRPAKVTWFARIVGASILLIAGLTLPVASASEATSAIVIGMITPDVEAAGSSELTRAVARAAEQGAAMAEAEHAFNAELFGLDFALLLDRATGAAAVAAAAERFVAEEGAIAVIGGFDAAEAAALSAWSSERGVPFLNVGASGDRLRHEQCAATAYHVEPSAAMYLDALAGWYVRSGFRNWFFVVGDDDESMSQYERLLWSLRERHFGAREAGRITYSGDRDSVVAAVRRANTDLVVLLLSATEQLEVLAALDIDGISTTVAGFPYPESQTRTFFAMSRAAAPALGRDHRATAWEATLDAYGAREINARFMMMFDEPMEPTAWATYQAVKIVFEAATLGGPATPEGVMAYLDGPQGVFDIWKGIGVTFRSWDRQLRQSLYLVKISETREIAFELASLVGELPAIYMPGTDPVERLDQLGDLREVSRCAP